MRRRHVAKPSLFDTFKGLRPQPFRIDGNELRCCADALKDMPGSPIAWSFNHKPVTGVEQHPSAEIEPLL